MLSFATCSGNQNRVIKNLVIARTKTREIENREYNASMIIQKASRFFLKIFRWKIVLNVTVPTKSVICVAPHSSNWDFVIGKLYAWSMGINAGFLMKKSWFFFPLGTIFRAMGGIPINRSKKGSMVQQMIDEFDRQKIMHLAITPEGTRKLADTWKLGFYHIAAGAKVPILLSYIDYKQKEMGIHDVFYTSGNETEDLQYIFNFYKKNGIAKYPERFAIPDINEQTLAKEHR